MEQSAPCTPESNAQQSVSSARGDIEMCDSRGAAMTPSSIGPNCLNNNNFINEAPSPLGQLDPHRLRDMVVDKQQNTNCQPHTPIESPYKQQQQQQQYWSPSPVGGCAPTPSPQPIMRSASANSNSPITPIMHHPSRIISQGSAGTPHSMREPSQILSPGGMRMQMQQQQMGMCMPGRSPLGSPGSMHPPPSPYLARPPSNTSPSAGAPPYMQPQPPQGAAMHYGGNPMQSMQQQTSSAGGVLPPNQMPPASPSGMVYPQRMPPTMGPPPPQQQYNPYHPQMQQPQWNTQPQTHYVGQPQMMGATGPPQRVMVQRVPYPAAGYPPAMSQPQSSSGRPPPQSPIIYPQGGPAGCPQPPQVQQAPPPQVAAQQRSLYAQAANQPMTVPSPQQPVPPQTPQTPQQPPPGIPLSQPQQYPPPPAYYQQKSQPLPGYPSSQPPMYRQQGPQSVPVRAYLSNQPSPMNSSPAYAMYPAVSVAPQPPPPVQPQQYSPVAPRYPTPVPNTSNISPCYPTAGPPPSSAHDMRSPQLMSPTQAPIVPAGVPQAAPPTMVAPVPANAPPPPMQRNIPNKLQTNGTSIAPQQHMQRMVPQSTPFYGHEPNIANNVSPDMCLIGCFFIVVEHERVLVDRLDLQEISAIVRLHGGEIEIGPRAYTGANSERITHVICESLRNQLVQQALKERKRCVTLQWLNDIIAKKHLEAPFRVSHLPTFWADNHRPATGKIIAINGFSHNERSGIRMMIIAIGARFTPYLTKHNHFLITKTAEGAKVEKSRELGVTVVNYQWLIELYLGMKTSIQENESAYCPVPGMFPEVNVSPYTLELYSEVCKQLLAAWRKPVIFSPDQWQRAAEVKRNVENDESIFPNKKLRMSTPPPTDEQIVEQRAQLGPLKDAPIVCFSGFTAEEVSALEKKVRFLGCQVTDCVSECTHLVVLNLWRTMKLLEAIALGKNIVGANWVTDGYRYRVIPDTLDYFARDDENEKAFGYNLKYSVLRARYRRVFEEVTFYVTPSVEPSHKAICSLISAAGGKVLKERPQPYFVIQCIETDSPLILVGNESDIHLLQYLTDCGMPVFNIEIVLTGILRQKLENSVLYRVAPMRSPLQQPSPNATQQQSLTSQHPPATSNRTQSNAQRVAT